VTEVLGWSIGIKFVQLQTNSALNKRIGRSPYETLFGKCATVGLTSETKISKEILATLEKEEDLLKLQLGDYQSCKFTTIIAL
jgi:hypothetical protein